MTKEKEKNEKNPTLKIPKREAGKVQKTNYLQNLRPFPILQSHPIEDLIGIKNPQLELNSQEESFGHSNEDTLGHPITEIIEHSNADNLDIRNASNEIPKRLPFGHPNDSNLDTQDVSIEHPNNEILDTQSPFFGHSNNVVLSVETPKTTSEAPKNDFDLDTLTPNTLPVEHSKTPRWKKYDQARSTVRVNLHIDKEIDKKVRQYCMIDANPKVELKEFYERSAIMFLEHLDTQSSQTLGAGTPFDERRMMLTSKTKAPIINLYLAYNSILNPKTKWTIKDDDAGSRLNDVDLRIIELGILQTQAQKNFKGKVHSFTYYTHEIENFLTLEIADETLNVMLKLNRTTWERATGKKLDLSFLDKEKQDAQG